MTHARNGLAWLMIIGLLVFVIGASWASPEAAEPTGLCPADCQFRLARGRPAFRRERGVEAVSGPICPRHDRPAK